MSQYLYTADVGTIYLRIDINGSQKSYVCSSLSLNMRLNTLPIASVVVGGGTSIRNGHKDHSDNNAENILEYVMNARNNTPDSFINCSIVEVIKANGVSSETVLFKGCIVAASLVYKTGSTTMRAVRVECMNEACKLYAQPLSAYNNTVGSYIVDALTAKAGRNRMPTAKESVTTYGMNTVGALTTSYVRQITKELTQHKDIATKIAFLADAITLLSTKVVNTVKPEEILRILRGGILKINKYIKSDYFINYQDLTIMDRNEEPGESAINNVTDDKFDNSLCDQLLGSLRSSTVYDAILRTIMSTEFMLNLVPKWNAENHVVSIEPSHAWESKPAITISFSDIAEFNSTYKPFDHINDPEVLAANFSAAIPFAGSQGQDGTPSAIMGAYSTNEEIAEWLKMRWSSDASEDELRARLQGDTTYFKWFIYEAPSWLRTAFIIPSPVGKPKEDTNNAQSDIKDQRTNPKEESKTTQQVTNSETAIQYDFERARSIADKIAKALYTHICGESATAQLTLLPDMRFGGFGSDITDPVCIEDHIGEIMDILPSEDSDQHLAMRGMIESVQFNYSAGKAGSCSYTITLSRVRPLNQQADDVVCPLYVRSSEK